jgi:hypothetical protein
MTEPMPSVAYEGNEPSETVLPPQFDARPEPIPESVPISRGIIPGPW